MTERALRSPHALHPLHDGPAEQAGRLEREHAHDQHQCHAELEVGADHVGAEHVLGDADDEATHHRARRIVDAAEQRSGEAVEQDAGHHVGVEVDDVRHHHAGDSADHGGEPPAQRQHAADANSDQPARYRVVGGRAHGEPERRETKEDVERAELDERDQHGADLVRRQILVGGNERRGERARERLKAVRPDEASEAVEDHQQANEDDDDRELRPVRDRAHDQPLDGDPHHEGDEHRRAEGSPIRHPARDQRPGDVGREHRHLALREIHEMGGLIDHHQRQRDTGIDAARGEPGQHLVK